MQVKGIHHVKGTLEFQKRSGRISKMKNIRKLFTIALCLALAAATGLTAFGQTEWSPATVSTSLVVVDGKSVAFGAYNIAGYNYFKLRDLAYAVNGSSKQFSVDWDGANNAIALTSGAPYTPEGSELQPLEGGGRTAWPTTSRITLDGTLVTFEAYNIDGYNYFKLRDVAKAFNIGVGWDGGRNLITISTDEDYVDDSGAAPPSGDTAPSTPPSQGALPTPRDPVTVTLVNHEPQFGTMKAYTPTGRIEIPNGAAIERGDGKAARITIARTQRNTSRGARLSLVFTASLE